MDVTATDVTQPARAVVEHAALRQAVEALRCGVVPARHVTDYTVGRDGELESFRRMLGKRQGMRLLFGDYGRGKTHLLELFEQMARHEGFVTTRIVLNPEAVPPSHPQRLYRALVQHLRYPDDTTPGLEPLLRRLEGSDAHATPSGDQFSRFFSPVLFARRVGEPELLDWLNDYIEGFFIDPADVNRALGRAGWDGPRVLALSDFRTYGRMYCHMLGTLADWAADAGYKGLVLLLDEVERVDVLTKEQRELAEEVLRHFAAATLPPSVLRFDPEALYKGGHSVHRSISLQFSPIQPLSVVMAFTPLDAILKIATGIVDDPDVRLDLLPFSDSQYGELVERLVDLYGRAHPGFALPAADQEALRAFVLEETRKGADAARHVVAGVVGLLDVVRMRRLPISQLVG